MLIFEIWIIEMLVDSVSLFLLMIYCGECWDLDYLCLLIFICDLEIGFDVMVFVLFLCYCFICSFKWDGCFCDIILDGEIYDDGCEICVFCVDWYCVLWELLCGVIVGLVMCWIVVVDEW